MRGTAEQLAKETIRRILADEATARRLGRALAALQQGKERLDRAAGQLFATLGIAGKADWKRLSRRIAGTRRRLREADLRLSRVEAAPGKNPPKGRRSSVDR